MCDAECVISMHYHREFERGLVGKYARVAQLLAPESSILEVGCHTGYFARTLIARGHRVMGLESDAQAAEIALKAGVPVVVTDVEDARLDEQIHGAFDVILLMDVLEHLRAPEQTLVRLKRLIGPKGCIIVTGPNVAYWAVRKELGFGHWNYTDTGILDRTHLHFYTSQTWRALLQESGYRIIHSEAAEGMLPFETPLSRLPQPGDWLIRFKQTMLRRAPEWFSIVYLFQAVPS